MSETSKTGARKTTARKTTGGKTARKTAGQSPAKRAKAGGRSGQSDTPGTSPTPAKAGGAGQSGRSARRGQPGKQGDTGKGTKANGSPATPSPAGTAARQPSGTGPAPRTDAPRGSAAPADASAPAALIRVPLPVRWRDLDAFNHVNNSKFLSYLEEARLQWMMTIPGEWMDDDVAPVVAAAHIDYRRPIEWPNDVVVELFVQRLGDTSLTIGHRITGAGESPVLYAEGYVVMVWIDTRGGRAARLPQAVRDACTAA